MKKGEVASCCSESSVYAFIVLNVYCAISFIKFVVLYYVYCVGSMKELLKQNYVDTYILT